MIDERLLGEQIIGGECIVEVVTPMRTCLKPIRARTSATRMSQAIASSAPPPIAGPASAAMTGKGASPIAEVSS